MRPRTYDEDRPFGAAAAGHHDQVVGADRCRRGDLRAATQPPELLPRFRIVAANEIGCVGDELLASRCPDHRRRSPRRQLVAIGLPHGLARCRIEREQKRIRLRVDLQDHQAVPDDRRAGGAPFVGGNVVGAHVHSAEVHFPLRHPVHVESVHTFGTEPRDDDAAVGGWRRAGVGGLDVALVARRPHDRHAFPRNLPRPLVERVQHPLVHGRIVGRVAVAVEPGLERCVRAAADRGRDKEAIAPDDGTRVRQSRDRRAPQHVLPSLRIPAIGQVLPVGNARRVRASEGWPAPLRVGRTRERRRTVWSRTDDLPLGHRLRFPFRTPRARVEDHAPRHAVIADGRQGEVRAVDVESILAGFRARFARGGNDEAITIARPRSGERRPALATEREHAVGCQPHREGAVPQHGCWRRWRLLGEN